MSSLLQNNITNLQELLEAVNALPEAGGIELPELNNEGSDVDLLSGKQLIDGDGNVVTGTFSLDNELSTQDDLIAQIQAAVDELPEAGSGGSFNGSTIETCTLNFSTSLPSNTLIMAYNTYENGEVLFHLHTYNDTIPTTITNFISNSMLAVYNATVNYTLVPGNNCEGVDL